MLFTTTGEPIAVVQVFFSVLSSKIECFFLDRYHQIPVTSSPTSTPTLITNIIDSWYKSIVVIIYLCLLFGYSDRYVSTFVFDVTTFLHSVFDHIRSHSITNLSSNVPFRRDIIGLTAISRQTRIIAGVGANHATLPLFFTGAKVIPFGTYAKNIIFTILARITIVDAFLTVSFISLEVE